VEIGNAAPSWKGLDGVDGKKHGLDDYKDAKVLVVAFTCNSCPVAKAYEDRFISFVKDYKEKGVAFVAINCNNIPADRLDKMKERAEKKGSHFDYVYDPSQKSGRAYGATVTPHLFVLDKNRRIAYMGAFDNNMAPSKVENHYVRDAVEALLAGKQPEISETRQFGCGIKYKPKPPEVALKVVDPEGYAAEIEEHQGKVILVDFWATWCIPCLKEFHHTVEWSEKYADQGLAVISVSLDDLDAETKAQALAFLKGKKAVLPNLLSSLDIEESMEAFDIESGALPHYKIYDRKGKLVKKFELDSDKPPVHSDIEAAIREALGLAKLKAEG